MSIARICVVAALAAAWSCGGSAGDAPNPVAPVSATAQLVMAQKTITDTIEATLSQALVAQVLDAKSRTPRAGVEVRFEAIDADATNGDALVARASAADFSRVAIDTTDASGQAHARVRLGTLAGNRRIAARAPSLTLADTATVVTTPGAALSVRSEPAADSAIIIGHVLRAGAVGTDRKGNTGPLSATVISSTPSVCSVDADGTVHGVAFGICLFSIASGTFLAQRGLTVIPDATVLVRRGGAIGSMSVDGSGFTQIADEDSLTFVTGRWLTNGDIALLESLGKSTFRLAIIGASGARQTFATLSVPADARTRISADGNWITASVLVPEGFRNSTVRVRRDGTSSLALSCGECDYSTGFTSISNDGNLIAYGNQQTLLLANFQANTVSNLGFGGNAAAFSADGSQFAILEQGGLDDFITFRRTDTQAVTARFDIPSAGFLYVAGWSADSRYLLMPIAGRGLNAGLTWVFVRVSDGKLAALAASIGTTYTVLGGLKP